MCLQELIIFSYFQYIPQKIFMKQNITLQKRIQFVTLRSLELGWIEYLTLLELIAQSRQKSYIINIVPQNSFIIYIVPTRIARTPIALTLEPDLWSLRQKYSENHTFSFEHKKTTKVVGRHVEISDNQRHMF
jgi:hypothetical protein